MTTTTLQPKIHVSSKTRQSPIVAPAPSSDMQDFEPCRRSLLQSLDFANLRWDERRDPATVSRAFECSWPQLDTAATTDRHRMAKGTFNAIADDRTKAKVINIDEQATQETDRLLRDAPVLSSDDLESILRAVHSVDHVTAFRIYDEALRKRAAEVIGLYHDLLERLRERGLVGSVTYGRHECLFTHVRTVFTDVERDRTEQSSEQTETQNGLFINRKLHTTTIRSQATVETILTQYTHRHLLAYPEHNPAPAPHVRKPKRIEKHEACIPSFMLPTYITGDLLSVTVKKEALSSRKDPVVQISQRTRIERKLNRENLVRAAVIAGTVALTIVALPLIGIGLAAIAAYADPALIVGNGQYVLSGWLPEELPLDRRYHIQRT